MGLWVWRTPITRGVYAVRCLAYSSYRVEGVVGAHERWLFLEEVPPAVLAPLLPGVCVVAWGGVGDDNGLPWGGARMYRHRCRRCLRGYVDGVFVRWCDGGIHLDGEEEVVAVRW